jgi:hypothetical protein
MAMPAEIHFHSVAKGQKKEKKKTIKNNKPRKKTTNQEK